jgi:facilitated trehalose transporter
MDWPLEFWSLQLQFILGRSGRFEVNQSISESSSIYLNDSDPKHRGLFLSGITLAMSSGLLVTHILGTFLTWKTTAIICGIFPILCFFQVLAVPETPPWLIKQGKYEEAETSFKWLRGQKERSTIELEELLKRDIKQDEKSALEKFKENIKRPAFSKPLAMITTFFFVMQFTGANATAFYSVSIMKYVMNSTVNEYFAMILFDTVRVVMSMVGCVLIRKFRRRTLTIFGGLATGILIQSLAVFMFVSRDAGHFEYSSYISLLLLIGYISAFSSAFYPLPFILKG